MTRSPSSSSRSSTDVKPRPSAPPKSASSNNSSAALAMLDAQLAKAGLARTPRSSRAGAGGKARKQQLTSEALRPAPAEVLVAPNGVACVTVPGWEKLDWLWHGFSTRMGGVSRAYTPEGAEGELNIGFTAEDTRENVIQNRRRLVEAITGDADVPLVLVRQIHSSVLVLAGSPKAGQPCKGDGLISNQPGILLGVQTADCIPVLVADRKRKVVGAFHAGWRGTVKRIVESGIGRMRLEFGCRPEDLVAAIGPGIGPCCYAVGEEVVSEIESQFGYGPELLHEVSNSDVVRAQDPMRLLSQRVPGHAVSGRGRHLDLMEANRRQLLAAGLRPKAVSLVGGCTNCQRDLFFSYRAGQGRTGRMLSVIGVRA